MLTFIFFDQNKFAVHLHNGGSAPESQPRGSPQALLLSAFEGLAQTAISGEGQGKSQPQLLEEVAYLEQLLLRCCSKSACAKGLKSFREGNLDAVFVPMTAAEFICCLEVLTGDKEKQYRLEDGTVLEGRGANWPAAIKLCTASGNLIKFGGLTSAGEGKLANPADSPLVKMRMAKLEDKWNVAGATSFRITDLPIFYEALFGSDSIIPFHPLRKVRVWSEFLTAMALHHRPSELTEYAPTLDLLHIPSDPCHYYRSEGLGVALPKRVTLGYPCEKTNKDVYHLVLHANPISPMYCPVFWLLYWLSASGIGHESHGPIYRNMKYGLPMPADE